MNTVHINHTDNRDSNFCYEHSETGNTEEMKKQLYNRQEYVIGAETQAKYGSTNVLVAGGCGLAAEVVKNLVLTGVRSVHIYDPSELHLADLSTNFFAKESDVGRPRGEVMAHAASELNRFVEVRNVSNECQSILELIPSYHVVIFVNHFTASLTEANAVARQHHVKFVSCESRGVAGCIFVDAGDAFKIHDVDGEETVSCVVTALSADGLVTLHEDKSHECEVGSQVYFTGIKSPLCLNSSSNMTSSSDKSKENSTTSRGNSNHCEVLTSKEIQEEEEEEQQEEEQQHQQNIVTTTTTNNNNMNNTNSTSSRFSATTSPTSLKLFEVREVVSPHVLVLNNILETIERDGSTCDTHNICVGSSAYLHTTKKHLTTHFDSLSYSIHHPRFANIFDSEAKNNAPQLLHSLFVAVGQLGQLPRNERELMKVLQIAETLYNKLFATSKHNEGIDCTTTTTTDNNNNDTNVLFDVNLAKQLLSIFHGDLNPMACFIGGLAAQEVLKVCSGKFTPIQQWLYYDVREFLELHSHVSPTAVNDSNNSNNTNNNNNIKEYANSRYAGQVAVFGPDFQSYIRSRCAFIVGSGALGCEHIKNMALIGLGKVSITDMDAIEMSNLSRQFLFRQNHIGKPKSTVAAQVAQGINPSMEITSYELKMDSETEGVFNEHFWEAHSLVLNALDNVQSRKYVDGRCLFYKRPLFESGTLGTKCNMQPVIPFVTESYSSSYDPPEKSIPLCTLKNFPNAIEHTIQWARDQFHLLFNSIANDVNSYLNDPETFKANLARDPASLTDVIRNVQGALHQWPHGAADCVKLARLYYEEYFHDNFCQLLHNLPLDKRNEDGQLFWSGAKKPPTPQHFNPHNKRDMEFIYHCACMLANVYDVREPVSLLTRHEMADYAMSVHVPGFVARQVHISTDENEESNANHNKTTTNFTTTKGNADLSVDDLPEVKEFASIRMIPQEFEKDDLSNHHVQFITYASNLRAEAYGIIPADVHKTRRIAGNIIPAMVTTTALVTGLVGFEMLKYLLVQYRHERHLAKAHYCNGLSRDVDNNNNNNNNNNDVDKCCHSALHTAALNHMPYVPTPAEVISMLSIYRSAFVNIALPFIAFSDPILAEGKTYTLPKSGKQIRWGVWDRIDVNEGRDITIMELVNCLQTRYELEVFMITLMSGKMLYIQFGGKAKDKERAVSEVAFEKGEEDQDGNDYLNLVVSGMIGDDEDVDVPVVRYKFRNFTLETRKRIREIC